MAVTIHTKDEIDLMRSSCILAAEALDYIGGFIKPGISTLELDKLTHDYIVNIQKAYPSPLNYRPHPKSPPYPNSICTSINNEICHGIPSANRLLKEGDIINIDVTIYKNGFHGDTSRTFLVGNKIKPFARRLVEITYECMWQGILQVKPGNYLGDVGYSIERHAHKNAYSVVEEYCGHGIGRCFHDDTIQVLHYGRPKTGILLKPGMIFTIEPMINQGKKQLKIMPDGWTAVTRDRSLSAQFEHTVLVTETGYEVLTVSNKMPALPSFVKSYHT